MGQMPTRAENPFNIFWHRNFSNLPTKFLLLGKRIMIYTKKLRDVTPPVQAKALLLLQKYLQHFLIWKFVKSTYKVYSSGKKKNDFYKKASSCNPASTGKSTTATAKAFEPLKLNDQYVRPPAQAQLKFRTFWWSHKFHNYANSYTAFNVAH